MPNSVHLAKYYKMMIPHKAGQGIKLLEHLQQSKVNLLAFLAFPEKKRESPSRLCARRPCQVYSRRQKGQMEHQRSQKPVLSSMIRIKWAPLFPMPRSSRKRKSTYGLRQRYEVARDAVEPFCGSIKRM